MTFWSVPSAFTLISGVQLEQVYMPSATANTSGLPLTFIESVRVFHVPSNALLANAAAGTSSSAATTVLMMSPPFEVE